MLVDPPSPAVSELPEFNGLQNNIDRWVATVNALAARATWSEHQKWCMAIDRLREGAAVWHQYGGITSVGNKCHI